jgi:hypothetical protein
MVRYEKEISRNNTAFIKPSINTEANNKIEKQEKKAMVFGREYKNYECSHI